MKQNVQVPTLLLGLGGIGSRIVDRVYGMIPEDERTSSSLIGVHAFDTNVNDIQKLEHLDGHVTQTSAPLRVKHYLNMAPPLVREWFPDTLPDGSENTTLLHKTLTEGAGQVRPVSRLAYRAAMSDGKLESFEQDLRKILSAQPTALETSLRVMIVCTLMGGTGAGMFLQTALFLREYFEDELGLDSYLIRGAFVLPDVLLQPKAIRSQTQRTNIQANAYACLKELGALSAAGADVDVDLEYKPKQVDVKGNPDLSVMSGVAPIKFSVLHDFFRKDGSNLGSMNACLRQVAKTTFLQLFSPISAKQFSEEDNEIIGLIEGGGLNRYAGAGVATLEYPYEDLIDYCALRWAEDSLSQQWMRLDDDFEQELRDWEMDKQAGLHRPRPKIEERYVRILQGYAAEDNPELFFREIHRSLHRTDDEGRLATPKYELFVSALDEAIEALVTPSETSEAPDFQKNQRAAQRYLNSEDLRDSNQAMATVANVERVLRSLEQTGKQFVQENKTALFNQAVLRDYRDPNKAGGQPERLNTWILDDEGGPMHPVAVRCFLYQVKSELEDHVQELTQQNEDSKSFIKGYEEAFNQPETEYQERPEDRVRDALNQGIMGRLFQNRLDDFAEMYENRAHRQRQTLIDYFNGSLKETVFKRVLSAIDALLEQLETYFRNLRSVQRRLDDQIRKYESMHDNLSDKSREFVLATATQKKTLWKDHLRRHLATETLLPEEVAQAIYVGQYDRYCKQFLEQASPDNAHDTGQEFQRTVVAQCRKRLQSEDLLDLDIVEALQKEARWKGADPDTYVEQKVNGIDALCSPLLNPSREAFTQDKGHTTTYWGAHPDVAPSGTDEGLGEDSTLSPKITEAIFGSDLIRHPNFSKQEILCYKLVYGLQAGDLPKFSAGSDTVNSPGGYFKAYRERIRQISQQDKTVTPHLDQRWHLPMYLPDTINPHVEAEAAKEAAESLIYGLALGLFRQVTVDQTDTWQFMHPDPDEDPRLVTIEGQPCSARVASLHEALRYHPLIVDHVLEYEEKVRIEDKNQYPLTDDEQMKHHRVYQGYMKVPGIRDDRNLLDTLYGTALEVPGEESVREASTTLVNQAADAITAYYVSTYGPHRRNQAISHVEPFLDKLRKEAPSYGEIDEGSALRGAWDNALQSGIDAHRGD